MSLQSRLFSFFVAIVVLPLGLAALLGQRIIVNELEQRTLAQLAPASTAAGAVYQARFVGARDRVASIAAAAEVGDLLLRKQFKSLSGRLRTRLEAGDRESRIDYLVVANPDGRVLAEALGPPRFLDGVKEPTAGEIVGGREQVGPRSFVVTRSIVPIHSGGSQIAVLVGGYYLDGDFLAALSEDTGVDASLFIGEQAVASTIEEVMESGPVRAELEPTASRGFLALDLAGAAVYAVPTKLSEEVDLQEAALVMSASRDPIINLTRNIRTYLVLLLVLAAVGSGLLGFFLARVITRPLREVAAGANAIAAGNYEQHIDIRSRDEVGQLARAFNEMAQRLAIHISELKESREELKRALTRFAQTLRSTHDIDAMVELILDTSLDTLRARGGTLMWVDGGTLNLRLSRGVEDAVAELEVNEGLSGHVAAVGESVRLPDSGAGPAPSPREPHFNSALSVPIFSQERVVCVLTLYDRQDGAHFTEADMGTLLSLADQAAVAIENVLLHEETKRQAITDGLTQVWNYRYFNLLYQQEIERATRFQRSFSLITLDIDDFKQVNDTYGHQRGDAVLVELATRVGRQIRDIDVLARHGGEEFWIVLPETDLEGGVRTAEKIREAVGVHTFGTDPPVSITISLGIACFPEHGADRTQLQSHADAALYEAKRKGKNRVEVHGGYPAPSP